MDMENVIKLLSNLILAILFILNVIIYVFVLGRILPKICLKVVSKTGFEGDRGLNKYVFKGGRGIVYSANPSYRNYVDKYLLYEKDGIKSIKCNVLNGVKTITYQIYMFDSNSKIIDTIVVSEKLISPCYTSNIRLNENTAYVKLAIRKVNGKKLDKEKFTKVKKSRILLFDLLSIVGAVIESYVINTALFKIMSIFHITTDYPLRISYFAILVSGVIVAFIYTRIILSHYKKKGVKLLRWILT